MVWGGMQRSSTGNTLTHSHMPVRRPNRARKNDLNSISNPISTLRLFHSSKFIWCNFTCRCFDLPFSSNVRRRPNGINVLFDFGTEYWANKTIHNQNGKKPTNNNNKNTTNCIQQKLQLWSLNGCIYLYFSINLSYNRPCTRKLFVVLSMFAQFRAWIVLLWMIAPDDVKACVCVCGIETYIYV